MKITIFGNGKMGKLIAKHAINRGHIINNIASSKIPAADIDLSTTDMVIDFSTPDTAFTNISYAINNQTAIVSGTTGWLSKLKKIHKICKSKNGSFLHSSNFSLGVNLFFQLNKNLTKIIQEYDYQVSIDEIHHSEKIDQPSGTAKVLADDINKLSNKKPKINSIRNGETTGIHSVEHKSKHDIIEIKHIALNRESFAQGAILAAEYLVDKKGIFTMSDVIKELSL
tara:strand:- start:913 stop:1590 length:678 start_codon:yes stop_codon:yes gene_type:complete